MVGRADATDRGRAVPRRARAHGQSTCSRCSYTSEGLKGLLKEGGSSRVAAIRKLTESRGGKIEAFYFAFGDDYVYLIG